MEREYVSFSDDVIETSYTFSLKNFIKNGIWKDEFVTDILG